MLAEITVATRLVIVCNPNNPTSTALATEEIAAFVAAVPPHVCVIVDEAYCEFNLLGDPDASIELLAAHPNLVLLRTFSKVYGLCGLRVGFALCGSPELPRAVDQVRQPFFCNALAQAAAVESLAHQDAVLERVTSTVAERISVGEALAPSAWESPTRRRTSAGSTSASATRARSCAGWRTAACSCAAARALGSRDAGAARHLWHTRRRTLASSPRSASCSETDVKPRSRRSAAPSALAVARPFLKRWTETCRSATKI